LMSIVICLSLQWRGLRLGAILIRSPLIEG
jgi:hypothetical protein